MDSDHALQLGALAIAREVQTNDCIRKTVERVDVRNGSLHVVPHGTTTDDFDREIITTNVESHIGDRPWTFSEWWTQDRNESTIGVFAPYWPTSWKCSKEQLEAYDDFVTHVERTGEPPSSNLREDWDTSIEVMP